MRYTKPIAATLAVTIAALSFSTSADARHRRHHHRGGGDEIAAGIFGFAAGALLIGALSQPRYGYPRYYEPQRVYVAPPPPPIVYHQGPVYGAGMEPWSPEWYSYCDARYISFDQRTGYFLGYDGEYHFCR